MILAMAMLLSVQTPPTVASIQRLTPKAAGDVVLAGKDHDVITDVVVRKVGVLQPPGLVELEMSERAKMIAGGCVRKRWTVNFNGSPSAPSDATLSGAYSINEVALRRSTGCPSNGYAQVGSGLEPSPALVGLAYLDRIQRRIAKAEISCLDSTSSGLCNNPKTLRQGLEKITPWLVKQEGDLMILWLGDAKRQYMQAVTEVSFSAMTPDKITITRRTPAPA